MRRALAGLMLLAMGAVPASASDGAAFDIIGYSKDGRYFAFEQFGIQDGSGFPYWQVFAIDLEKDAFVEGSPIRVRIDSEEAELSEARAMAAAKADAVLKPLKLTVPAQILAANFSTELETGDGSITFARYYPVRGRVVLDDSYLPVHKLEIERQEAKESELGATCGEPDGPYYALKLTLTDVNLKQSHTIFDEKKVPESRGCPIAYKITAIAGAMGAPDTDRLVAIISVFTRGFEGIDERFIAVPFTLSD